MTVETLITDHIDLWTGAVTQKNASGRGSSSKRELTGIKKLRELILELAIRGKLVPQDNKDGVALDDLERLALSSADTAKAGAKRKPVKPVDEAEQIFKVPESWAWVRLGRLGNTVTGGTPKKANPNLFGAHIPFIKPGDIEAGIVDYANEGLSEEGYRNLGRSAGAGSVLMVCIGTIGKCALIDRECAFNQQINALDPYCHDYSQYLYSCLRSKSFQDAAWEASSSTTIAILNKGRWESIPVPIPPLAEQHRIVQKVDELMALCDQLEQQTGDQIEAHERLVDTLLDTLTRATNATELAENWARVQQHFDTLFTTEHSIERLKQTILQLAVMGRLVPQDENHVSASQLLNRMQKLKPVSGGRSPRSESGRRRPDRKESPFETPKNWRWEILGELGTTLTGSTPSKSKPRFFGDDIPFIKPGDLIGGNVDYENEGLSDEGLADLGKWAPQNSILMVCIGTIGKCALIERPCAFNQQINAVTPHVEEMAPYLYLYMQSKYFQSEAWERSSSTTISILNKGNWSAIPVPVPPLEEQLQIVQKADELLALCDRIKACVSGAELIKGRLANAFVEQSFH